MEVEYSKCFKVLKIYKLFSYLQSITNSKSVIYLQIWAYGSWGSLFTISMAPTANL